MCSEFRISYFRHTVLLPTLFAQELLSVPGSVPFSCKMEGASFAVPKFQAECLCPSAKQEKCKKKCVLNGELRQVNVCRDLKEDLDAMVRIEVPRKGILACNSSTAGEAIEYLKEVSLG